MDGWPLSLSSAQLYARLGSAVAPVVIDLRTPNAHTDDEPLIIGALERPPEQVEQWSGRLRSKRPVLVYCRDGGDVSQAAASVLRHGGVKAAYLEGGITAWKENALPTRRKPRGISDDKWVTREHPKIDRIACPWLISRFINPLAEFMYVPARDVSETAQETGAIPYDIKDVMFGHHGERCSFDAIVEVYDIHDAALDKLATIVRGADTGRPDLAPQCDGLLAISQGLSANFPDDHEMLRHGLIVYDALYAWCRLEIEKRQHP